MEPDEIESLRDKVEGLTADLYSAVRVAYRRGAVEWTRLNYPQWYEHFQAEDAAGASNSLPESESLAKAVRCEWTNGESEPKLLERKCGGWLAVAPQRAKLRVGATGSTEAEAREAYWRAVARWWRVLNGGAEWPVPADRRRASSPTA